ncbi:hypothetical protein LOK49_LG13G02801 [Camellia lanceoleosa]|uniref:Uncharacterized protein n=1 Tax=Camellia lanceoleosa TaxID=1840588 RepID=A0ACC0FG41_9ERIC|nr:hypothetical protein LOK49_LG13G02801 [Camellia lanceoleosa]
MQENCVSGVGNHVCVLYNSLKFGVSCAMHKPKNMEWQFGIKAYEHVNYGKVYYHTSIVMCNAIQNGN